MACAGHVHCLVERSWSVAASFDSFHAQRRVRAVDSTQSTIACSLARILHCSLDTQAQSSTLPDVNPLAVVRRVLCRMQRAVCLLRPALPTLLSTPRHAWRSPSARAVLHLDLLPRSVAQHAILPFLLTTPDLLALAVVDRATRRLVLTPSVWRRWRLRARLPEACPALPAASAALALPSLCDAVQHASSDRHRAARVELLGRFPNLQRLADTAQRCAGQPAPLSPLTRLAAAPDMARAGTLQATHSAVSRRR